MSTSETGEFYLLVELPSEELEPILKFIVKHGIKGMLQLVFELAQYNSAKADKVTRERGERIARELGALIERMDGFEELERG